MESVPFPLDTKDPFSDHDKGYIFDPLSNLMSWLCLKTVLVCSGSHTRTPWTGHLKLQNFNFSASRGLKSKIKVLAVWFLVRTLFLPGLQTTTFSCPHLAFPLCVCVEKERSLGSFPLLIRIPAILDKVSTLMASFNYNYLFKNPTSKYIHMGLGLQHMYFRKTQFSPHHPDISSYG